MKISEDYQNCKITFLAGFWISRGWFGHKFPEVDIYPADRNCKGEFYIVLRIALLISKPEQFFSPSITLFTSL